MAQTDAPHAELLDRIVAYCADGGISESTFGFKAVCDGKLVERLRKGGDIQTATLSKIEAQLARPAKAGRAA